MNGLQGEHWEALSKIDNVLHQAKQFVGAAKLHGGVECASLLLWIDWLKSLFPTLSMLIAHRINTLAQLEELPPHVAIEFDVRDSGGLLLVEHDPFVPVEPSLPLESFLEKVGERFLIVNIKSEGIEPRILTLLKEHSLERFFLLDCSFPMIVKLSNAGEKRIAVRYSEYESLETVFALQGKVSWVWIDCFTWFPLTKEEEQFLHVAGFNLCIVSPELQGQPEKIQTYKNMLATDNILVDAICTKYERFQEWVSLFEG